MKHAALIVLALAISVSATLSGCGKSKKQLEAEATAKQEAQLVLERQKVETEQKRLAEEQKKVDEALITRLQSQTAQQMKDPTSTQFRSTHLNTTKTALCGQVNAKNSFGGYVGFRDFITTDKEVFIKPEACGTAAAANMPLSDIPACGAYSRATITENTCD